MKKRIRTQGMLIALGVILFLSFSRFFFRRSAYPVPGTVLDAAGLLLFLAGFLLRVSARGCKAQKPEGSSVLLTQGPYGWSRNPMYLGTLLIGCGFLLMFAHGWVVLLCLAVFAAIYIPQVKKEEAVLSRIFGPVYEDYRRRVPVFFPDPRVFFSQGAAESLPIKPAWLKREAPSLAACLAVMLLLKLWEPYRDLLAKRQWESFFFFFLVAAGGFFYLVFLFLSRRHRRLVSRRKA